MKDIFTIILRLTISCMVAGAVMGATFILTDQARKHNEHQTEQRVMLGLLGYSAAQPAPASLAMHRVYRYIVGEGENTALGYLMPLAGAEDAWAFITIDLAGQFLARQEVKLSPEQAAEEGERHQAIVAAIGQERPVRFADQTVIVTEGGERRAYLLTGEFPGFKTFIRVMLALSPDFSIRGLEIMEHEEDPGLGAEITQDYFKNQFRGKEHENLKDLEVAKVPLPEEYRAALEDGGGLTPDQVAAIEAQYKDKDIYALTGATISSRAVTNGVKSMVKKFAYRLAILDRIIKEQGIAVPF